MERPKRFFPEPPSFSSGEVQITPAFHRYARVWGQQLLTPRFQPWNLLSRTYARMYYRYGEGQALAYARQNFSEWNIFIYWRTGQSISYNPAPPLPWLSTTGYFQHRYAPAARHVSQTLVGAYRNGRGYIACRFGGYRPPTAIVTCNGNASYVN